MPGVLKSILSYSACVPIKYVANLGIVPECGNQPLLVFVYVEYNKAMYIISAFKILYYIGRRFVPGFLYFSKPRS
jgi:hypothetical protein